MELYNNLVKFFGITTEYTSLGDFLPAFLGLMIAVTVTLFVFGSISQMVRSVTR